MSKDSFHYEMPWRTNYESIIAGTWAATAIAGQCAAFVSDLPYAPFVVMSGICGTMALKQVPKALRLHRLQKHLSGRELEFIKLDELKNKVKNIDGFWLGNGFYWEQRHTQRVFEITKRDWSEVANLANIRNKKNKTIGQHWIHGVEPIEKNMELRFDQAGLHTLAVGSTGSGKTRLFDLLINQSILLGECVIIIDPKGDKEMRDNARAACRDLGMEDKFLEFHPAFPERSVRLDPLKNFTRVTEIASRIASIIQSDSPSDPFISFAWQAINNIAQGLILTEKRPTLITLRRYIENGAEDLVIKTVTAYGKREVDQFDEIAAEYFEAIDLEPAGRKKARIAIQMYQDIIATVKPSSELEGLINTFKHDPAHFSKMIQNILPMLNMLTSGELGKMLSPDVEDENDDRLITDMQKVINNKQVIYVGLDSLTDNKVASAIGSMILADLVSVAGDRYNFGEENRPVNIYVDEAAEVLNDPFIAALNKGRGALFRLTVATQTFADFVARLGSKEKANQVLANINNIIALRTTDTETQTYIAEMLPPTRIKYVMRTQGQNTHGDEPFLHGGNQGERLMEEEAPLFQAQLLGLLPNLEYIAKLAGGDVIKGRLPILVSNGA